MKRLILMLLLATFYHSYGQDKNLFVYGSGGLGIGKTHLGIASLNCIYKKHFFSITYYKHTKQVPYELPGYEAPISNSLWKDFDFRGPVTEMNLLGIMYGRVWNIYNPYVRLIAKGGVFAGNYSYPNEFSGIDYGWKIDYFIVDKIVVAKSIVLHPAIEFNLRTVNLSVGYHLMLSNIYMHNGVDINCAFGFIRNPKHHKPKRA